MSDVSSQDIELKPRKMRILMIILIAAAMGYGGGQISGHVLEKMQTAKDELAINPVRLNAGKFAIFTPEKDEEKPASFEISFDIDPRYGPISENKMRNEVNQLLLVIRETSLMHTKSENGLTIEEALETVFAQDYPWITKTIITRLVVGEEPDLSEHYIKEENTKGAH